MSSVDDLNVVAFVLTEDGEFPPVPKREEVFPSFPKQKHKPENSPFHYKDIIVRFLIPFISSAQAYLRTFFV